MYLGGHQQVDESLLRSMSDRIAHRGPDDHGYFCRGPIGLAHRRLSIIDLSPAGHQPMANKAETIWIAFNGEIYNFQELRTDLERSGRTFLTHTDTEVIIALYEKYGEDCLQYLRGMFAFALWDEPKQKLFLARDRVGKKPLKYYLNDEMIVFGSELKAFFADPSVPREADNVAIHHYLSFQYVPSPMTGFGGIKKLPPAHYMTIQNGVVKMQRYWDLSYISQEQRSEGEWNSMILQELETAVRLRMISDVPIGAFLSGGVDSSAVVAMMAKLSSRPVKTFSIGFPEESHNELPYAKKVAEIFGTEHTEFVVEPHALDVLPKLVYHYEEPYADSSAVPTYYVSQLTRKHVTVVLNGDGGDENFAGYGRYNVQKFAAMYDRVPAIIRRQLIHKSTVLAAKLFKTTFFDRAQRFSSSFSDGRARRYLEYICYFNELQKHLLYTTSFAAKVSGHDSRDLVEQYFLTSGTNDPVDQALSVDFRSYLPDDLLVKVDIASMAVALEGRSPLLDHKFLEMTSKIPSSLKIRGGEKKYIFKKALENILPKEILYRKKMGFGVPIEHWFRGELKGYVRDRLLGGTAIQRGVFQQAAVERLINEHQHTKINHAHQLWALLTLEMWYQTFIDKAPEQHV